MVSFDFFFSLSIRRNIWQYAKTKYVDTKEWWLKVEQMWMYVNVYQYQYMLNEQMLFRWKNPQFYSICNINLYCKVT